MWARVGAARAALLGMPCVRDGRLFMGAAGLDDRGRKRRSRTLVQSGVRRVCGYNASSAVTALGRVLSRTLRLGTLSGLAFWGLPPETATPLPGLDPARSNLGIRLPPSDCPDREAGAMTSRVTPWLARSRAARPHHAHAGCSGIMRGQALVAQPDRVVASEAIGRGFESLRAHQFQFQACPWTNKSPREIEGFLLSVHQKVYPDLLAPGLIVA